MIFVTLCSLCEIIIQWHLNLIVFHFSMNYPDWLLCGMSSKKKTCSKVVSQIHCNLKESKIGILKQVILYQCLLIQGHGYPSIVIFYLSFSVFSPRTAALLWLSIRWPEEVALFMDSPLYFLRHLSILMTIPPCLHYLATL